MIEIRPYRDTDAGRLLHLVRQLQAAEAVLYDRMKPAEDMGMWYIDLLKKQCAEDDGTLLVACDGEDLVGYATILTGVIEDGSGDELPYAYAYIGDLVVTGEARGRGIARKLIEDCEKYARTAGRDELRISVLAENGRARHVYLAAGFSDLLIDMRKKLG